MRVKVSPPQAQDALRAHLAQWGLRRFTSDDAYFQWQRETLFPADLTILNRQVEVKRRPCAGPADDILFYDLTAQPRIVPVLYSQRYNYYCEIGPRIAARIGSAPSILDIGCGVGILTTFYARQFPDRSIVGIDRSPASITVAQEKAKELGLANVRFECMDLDRQPIPGTYDLIVATHVLVQAEQNPGIPSDSWRTFERAQDQGRQQEFEHRTEFGLKLDRFAAAVKPGGRVIVFEKTRQLARRVPFQRALAARGFTLLEQPEPIRYLLVEEVTDDGPFYVLTKRQGSGIAWDESPEPDEGSPFDRASLKAAPSDPNEPLYENHWPSAQRVWEGLKGKQVTQETTRQEPDGRQIHVELGTADSVAYLYVANTFDQRQLVIVEPARASMLETYYQEIIAGTN